jgi:glucose-1-phosphate thymidylyltransferase
MALWGLVPAAGAGSRIQPLAFSKELLPVGSRIDERDVERPRAVSEFIVERLIAGGADRLCFIISPGKSDILEYYGGEIQGRPICYVVQSNPAGLCDAIFKAAPFVMPDDRVMIGLPDTVWFPVDALQALPEDALGLLLFPVAHPELFDAVVMRSNGAVVEVQVKHPTPTSTWVWGAIGMPGAVLHELRDLWEQRGRQDAYIGSVINTYLARGGVVKGVPAGDAYVDVGTLHGYREALLLLAQDERDARSAPATARAPFAARRGV